MALIRPMLTVAPTTALDAIILQAGEAIADRLARTTPRLEAALFGSVGIYVKCPEQLDLARRLLRPSFYDLDVVTSAEHRSATLNCLQEMGYLQKDKSLRMLQRPALYEPTNQFFVEVFTAPLELYHDVHCEKRLDTTDGILEIGDLLLSKIQYENLVGSRLVDLVALFASFGDASPGAMRQCALTVAESTRQAWGFTETVRRNLGTLRRFVQTRSHVIGEDAAKCVLHATRVLRVAIEEVEKPLAWYVQGCARRLPVVKTLPLGAAVDDSREASEYSGGPVSSVSNGDAASDNTYQGS